VSSSAQQLNVSNVLKGNSTMLRAIVRGEIISICYNPGVYILKPECDSQRYFRCIGNPPVLLLVLWECTGAAFGSWGMHRCCFWFLGNAPVLLLVLGECTGVAFGSWGIHRCCFRFLGNTSALLSTHGESTGAAFDYFCIQVT
jgi:hypothetical protein